MLFSKSMLAFMPLMAGLVAASAGLSERDVCISLNGPVIQVYITTQTVNQPVLINTYVPSNGVVSAAGTTIIVNNAPTQLVTVVNSQATLTNSQSATVTVGPNGISTQVGPSISLINFPVYINTFVQQNTIINNNGAVITINNAPTSIVTTATGTITSTVTTTQTITSNVVQPTVIVQVAGANAPGVKKVRRQNAVGFLAADGSLVNSCSAAAQLVIEDGQLFVDETSQIYSANTNDTVITFAAGSVVKPVNTVFSYNPNNATVSAGLSWVNTAFNASAGNAAVFFVQNNFLKAQLKGAAPIAPASLQTIAAARCQNGQIVSSTTTTTAATSTSTSSRTATTTVTVTGSTTVVGTTTVTGGTTTVVGTTTITPVTTTLVGSTTTAATTTTSPIAQAPPGGF